MRRIVVFAGLLVLSASSALAQQPDTAGAPRPAAATADTVLVPGGPTPAGAFLRSALVPGWGQGAVGSYWRGGIYFGGHLANVFMLLKTRGKLEEVRGREARRERMLRDSLLAENPELPSDSVALAIENDLVIGHAQGLQRSREQQQEDWLVWGAFWLLANAVDAYVAAQLADFPGDLILRPATAGTLELGVSLRPGGRK